MQMKVSFVLGLIVLIGISAVPVMADGGPDPTVIVNRVKDPVCPPGLGADYACFSVNDQADPLFTSNTHPENFVWDGAGPLTALFVEFTFIPGQIYTCTSDIFALCGTVAPSVNPTKDLEFEFVGGSIQPGDEVSAGVSPEPETLILFGTGLISLLGFRRKKVS
jgi:hypothetical protein